MKDYQDTLDFLFSQLPMYQRIGPAAYKANLDNTHALINHLGNPEKAFRSIHIAGTNGKGSVAHMLASVLQAQGLKTGLATSPHLKDFRERIRINGKPIPQDEVVKFVQLHKAFFENLQPSFFEMTMAMTFDYFAKEKVDIAVVETGMGGRLDSSNVITPEVSVITNIGLDHVRFLGNTLPAIAGEKAGIIKAGIPVVIGRRQEAVQGVFEKVAASLGAPLKVAGDHVKVQDFRHTSYKGRPCMEGFVLHDGEPKTIYLDLPGEYQLENLITVIAVVDTLRAGDVFPITRQALEQGLLSVVRSTGMQGRWQQLSSKPAIICDTGHNREGLKYVVDQLLTVPCRRLRMVFGLVDDKDLSTVLSLLPRDAVYYFCKPDVPRGLDEKKLASEASFWGLRGICYDSVMKALHQAKNDATADDLIFIGGSTFVVAEAL